MASHQQYTYSNKSTTQTSSNQNNTSISLDELAGKTDFEIEQKVKDFSELLDSIQLDNLNDKKKRLWKEIYENAISDRQNSFIMFKELYTIVKNKPTEHAVHAKNMSSYLERMAKSNDQLIKLAELIADAETKSETIDSDDMYARILSNKNS